MKAVVVWYAALVIYSQIMVGSNICKTKMRWLPMPYLVPRRGISHNNYDVELHKLTIEE
jgi:hypothetical protein